MWTWDVTTASASLCPVAIQEALSTSHASVCARNHEAGDLYVSVITIQSADLLYIVGGNDF